MIKKANILDKEMKLWWELVRVKRLMTRARQHELQLANLSFMESSVFQAIKYLPNDPTPADIAKWLIRRPSAITFILNKMEERGFILKIDDSNNKLVRRVKLTKIGEEAYQFIEQAQTLRKIINTLTDEEKQKLDSIIMKLQEKTLEELGMPTKPLFPWFK